MSSDLSRLFKRAVLKTVTSEGIPAKLGKADGSTLFYVDDAGTHHKDRVWARIGAGTAPSEAVVRCVSVPQTLNLPVIVADREGVLTVIRTDTNRAVEWSDGQLIDVAPHNWTHGRYGSDSLYITGLSFLPLAAYPSDPPDLTVEVEQCFYRYQNTHKVFERTTSDSLTAYRPAGTTVTHYVILALNRSTNALTVIDGDDVSGGNRALPSASTVLATSGLRSEHFPICAIRLYNAQTQIMPRDIFMDLRLWAGESSASGSGSSGSAAVVGPDTSTDHAIARWDGIDGTLLQDSYPTIDDSGNVDLQGNELRDYSHQMIEADTGAAYEIDWSAAGIFELTLTDDPTFTFVNESAGRAVTLILIQDGVGGRTVTWPGAVEWPNDIEPVLFSGVGDADTITLICRNDGSTVSGFAASDVRTNQPNTWTVGSQIIQTDPDTLTAFQVFDADGGAPVLSVDTINERVGIGVAAPDEPLHIVENINAAARCILLENLNAGASADVRLDLRNDTGVLAGFFLGSSTRGSGFANNALYYCANDITFLSDNLVATGGTATIQLIAGGFNVTPQIYIEGDGDGGRIGINTASPSRRLTMAGDNASAVGGPNIRLITDADAYPQWETFIFTHDNMGLVFDAYFDGSDWRSSDAGSNYMLYKYQDKFGFWYNGGTAAGDVITWNDDGLILTNAGLVGIGTKTPGAMLQIEPSGPTVIGQIIKLDASQSENAFEVQNSAAAIKCLIGPDGEIQSGIGAFDSEYRFLSNSTVTATAGSVNRNRFSVAVNPGAASSATVNSVQCFAFTAGANQLTGNVRGFYFLAQQTNSNVANTHTLTGVLGEASQNHATGAVRLLYGGDFSALVSQGGPVNNIYGVRGSAGLGSSTTLTGAYAGFFQYQSTSTGDVSDVYAVYVNSPRSTNAGGAITRAYGYYFNRRVTTGPITNLYGLKFEDVDQGTTLNYALYTGAGDVRFGDSVLIDNLTTTKVGLTVQGAAAQTASLLQLQDSAAGVVVDSGHGLTGSEFVFNQGGIDIDFRVESLNEDHLLTVDAALDVVRLGDWDTNYAQFDVDGDLSFTGTARIDWGKVTADNVTLNAGTTAAGVVADLQTLGDGNFYHIVEAAATPGLDLEVEFVSVTAFNWVQIVACYDGAANHSVGIQLYNFNTTAWDTFNAAQTGQENVTAAGEYILDNHSFFVPADANYIGTVGDAGDVRVRFHHTMAGNSSHDLYIDVVALYQ